MLIPVLFGAHPIVYLYTNLDLALAALIGHDGFAYPGSASIPHWIHHDKMEVNFGENYAPFDWLFGTFAATPDEADRVMAGYRKSGATAATSDKKKSK